MDTSWMVYGGFTAFVLAMLALDLGVFHRKSHQVGLRESLVWTAVWVTLALLFGVGIWIWKGPGPGMEYVTGYLIEKSLSVDNLFVFVLVFSSFRVPEIYQHKILFWGVLGALLMRAVLIAAGAAVLAEFHWVIYVFGGILMASGVKLLLAREGGSDLSRGRLAGFLRRILPLSEEYHGDRFWTRTSGRLVLTPLFLVLLIVEVTDLVFAVDSIPAIFAVTKDPFIVYTSNVFALLGLRSLYFALAGVMSTFRYLKVGLSAILCFVGLKMLLMDVTKIPAGVSLGVILGILTLAIGASLVNRKGKGSQTSAEPPQVCPAPAQSEARC